METTKLSEKNKDFFKSVYQVVRLIPAGRVTSYGAIANYLGAKRGARMVGWAMNGAHHQTAAVPAQRVVNRSGLLTGRHHFNPPELMQELLELEGLVIKDHQIQQFEKYFWDPLVELDM